MTTMSAFLILIPLAVLAACIGFVAFAIRGRLKQTEPPGPVRQVIMIAAAMFLFSQLGATFIAPTGPGSGMPLFLTLLLPCGLFLVIGPWLSRILAVLIACACLAGAVSEHRAKQRFGERMRARLEQRRQEAFEQYKRNTEQTNAQVFSEAAPSAASEKP